MNNIISLRFILSVIFLVGLFPLCAKQSVSPSVRPPANNVNDTQNRVKRLEDSESQKKNTIAELNLVNNNDRILWAGYKFPGKFDSNLIKNDSMKEENFKKGLIYFEEKAKEGSLIHQETLAIYYCEEKEFKKGLYWANKCTEVGSSIGMYLLAGAYMNGQGVIRDFEESLKWIFLAAAAGNENAKNNLAEIKRFFYGSLVWERQKEIAQDWIKNHPTAFFNPD